MKEIKSKEVLIKGGMGTTSLVCGIVGIFLFGIVLGPLAIIFGGVGISKKQKYSVAGLVLGIISVISYLIFTSIFLASFATL